MVYVIEQHKLAYFPVPKNACTSLKNAFYLLKNGKPFVDYIADDGKFVHVHTEIFSEKFTKINLLDAQECFRFGIVRDPIKRFLSSYENRVLYHAELSEENVHGPLARELGLKVQPDLNEFVDKLEAYRLFSWSIGHHTDPQTYFLGSDPNYFHKLYNINRLDDLLVDIEARIGIAIEVPRMQISSSNVPVSELSTKSLQKLKEFYSGDYAFLRDVQL